MNSGKDDAGRWGAEARATFALGWPIVVTQVAMTLLTTTAIALAGKLSRLDIAVVSLANNLYYPAFMFSLGVVTAIAPMVAQAVGRKRQMVRDVRRTVRQGFWVALAVGLCGVTLLWFAEPILVAFGQAPLLAKKAAPYARIMACGLVPALWFIALRNFVTALSRPRVVMVIAVCAVVFNVCLGWSLSQERPGLPGLGVQGIAISYAATSWFMFLLLLAYCYTQRTLRRYHLLGRFWRADWRRFRDVLRLGVPIGLTVLMEVGLFSAAVFMMGILGADSLAAHQIALQLASLAFMVPLGMSQAVAVRVGIAAGAGDPGWIARAGWTGIALGTSFVVVSAALFVTIPRMLIGLFIDVHDEANAEVVRLASAFLVVAAAFQIVDALQALGAGALRGLKDTRWPMMMAAFGYWAIGFPVAWILGFRLGVEGVGVWLGLAAGLTATAGLMIGRFALRDRFRIGRAAS
ncbi:MAG: MATE family efflux transporter [Ferrovibrionaceae bacterium]